MRQKKVKNATVEVLSAGGVITAMQKIDLKGKKAFLEIGSGKGQFIASLAKAYPEITWIALEVNINVCYRIFEKKQEFNLDNLIIILDDANHILGYFDHDVIDGIFLNFSDPWPKPKHHKRRLSHPIFLKQYQMILKKDAVVQMRTDHFDLFSDSLEYFAKDFDIFEHTEKLLISDHMTEYEEKKRQDGPIYQFKARVKHDQSNL